MQLSYNYPCGASIHDVESLNIYGVSVYSIFVQEAVPHLVRVGNLVKTANCPDGFSVDFSDAMDIEWPVA